jgi:hypothetical protein
MGEWLLQKAVRDRVGKISLTKWITYLKAARKFRPSRSCWVIRDVKPTRIDIHVLSNGPSGVRIPLDGL